LKCVILAGGYGTRIIEETLSKPKPLIEIGGKPILWHIMKIYQSFNINDFVICLGYKEEVIKEYFKNKINNSWNINFVDTGLNTNTGGRIKKIQKLVENETFCLSYGDDLKKVNIVNLINFHKKQNKMVTMTVTKPQPRYGIVKIKNDAVIEIREKSKLDESWINGGYFVLEPQIFDHINGDDTSWESESLKKLVENNQVSAFKYEEEYYPMDTLYDKIRLEELWNSGKAYWKTWK